MGDLEKWINHMVDETTIGNIVVNKKIANERKIIPIDIDVDTDSKITILPINDRPTIASNPVVYLIAIGDDNYYKVGYSANYKQRYHFLQYEVVQPLKTIFTVSFQHAASAYQFEQGLHGVLMPHLVHGKEWYRFDKYVLFSVVAMMQAAKNIQSTKTTAKAS